MIAKINNREVRVRATHSNNSGLITIFIQSNKGVTKTDSFSSFKYTSVEKFLESKYKAKIISL